MLESNYNIIFEDILYSLATSQSKTNQTTKQRQNKDKPNNKNKQQDCSQTQDDFKQITAFIRAIWIDIHDHQGASDGYDMMKFRKIQRAGTKDRIGLVLTLYPI